MTGYIDKQALLKWLSDEIKVTDNCTSAWRSLILLRHLVSIGQFDVKPEPAKQHYWMSPTLCPNCWAHDDCMGPTCNHWPLSDKTDAQIASLKQRVERLEKTHSRPCVLDENHRCRHVPQKLSCDWDGKRCRCSP